MFGDMPRGVVLIINLYLEYISSFLISSYEKYDGFEVDTIL